MLLLAVCVLPICSAPASAGMIGQTLSWQYYAWGGPYTGVNLFTADGLPDGNFTDGSDVYFNVSAGDDWVTFDYSVATTTVPWSVSGLSLAPTIYNGIAIRLVSGSIPDIISVAIDPVTNMAGFDLSRISFTAREIQVDWQELPWDTSTIVKLDVDTAAGVPEPGAFWLIGAGLAALAVWRKRPAA